MSWHKRKPLPHKVAIHLPVQNRIPPVTHTFQKGRNSVAPNAVAKSHPLQTHDFRKTANIQQTPHTRRLGVIQAEEGAAVNEQTLPFKRRNQEPQNRHDAQHSTNPQKIQRTCSTPYTRGSHKTIPTITGATRCITPTKEAYGFMNGKARRSLLGDEQGGGGQPKGKRKGTIAKQDPNNQMETALCKSSHDKSAQTALHHVTSSAAQSPYVCNVTRGKMIHSISNRQRSIPFNVVPTGDELMFRMKYCKGRELGRGSYGKVYELHKNGAGNRPDGPPLFVVKKIDLHEIRRYRNGGDAERMKREVAMLKTLDHPNIVKTHEVYASQHNLWAVMEFCSGGEMLTRYFKEYSNCLTQPASYLPNEGELKVVFRCIFEALAYLHNRKIAHRDIKPENFMWASKRMDAEIKLIDFGLASYSHTNAYGKPTMRTRAGTPLYVSPEIVYRAPLHAYGCECDCWSAGIILHLLLTGEHPFKGPTDPLTLEEVVRKEIEWSDPKYRNLSQCLIDMLNRLLQKDPAKRLTAEQAIEHPWIKIKVMSTPLEAGMTTEEGQNIIKSICRFHAAPRLKKFALMIIAKLCDDDQIIRLRKIFRLMDQQHAGSLSVCDIKATLEKVLTVNQEIPTVYFDTVLEEIATDGGGRIEYNDFIAASLSRKEALMQQNLETAFLKLIQRRHRHVNTKVDTIKVSDLEWLLSDNSQKQSYMRQKELRSMIQEVTANLRGDYLTLQDFTNMIKNPFLDKVKQNFDSTCSAANAEIITVLTGCEEEVDRIEPSPPKRRLVACTISDTGDTSTDSPICKEVRFRSRFSETMAKLFNDSMESDTTPLKQVVVTSSGKNCNQIQLHTFKDGFNVKGSRRRHSAAPSFNGIFSKPGNK